MFKDLQNYVPGQTQVSAEDMNTLRDVVRFLRNMGGNRAIVSSLGSYFLQRNTPAASSATMLRISGTVSGSITGREKYGAYIQVASTNAATVRTGTNHAGYNTGPYQDGEFVIFTNHWHSQFYAPDSAITNPTHFLLDNSIVPAFLDANVAFEWAGTSRCRVFWNHIHPPAMVPVITTQVGGSPGGSNTATSLTYDVRTMDGKLLSSNIGPAYGGFRLSNVAMESAGFGFIFPNELDLSIAVERPLTHPGCSG